MPNFELYVDGASKGNPGHSGVGAIVIEDGQVVKNVSEYIGQATNNVAEYTALIHGLQACLILKAQNIRVYADSELLCRQINRIYKVKNPGILKLYQQALQLFSAFKEVKLTHIPRENNSGADRLANLAVKRHLEKV